MSMTIKEFCIKQIEAGKTNSKIAELAQNKFGSGTTPACVAWYRCHLKREEEAAKAPKRSKK